MIGDQICLLNRVRDPKNLEAAFAYAAYDRKHGDHFCDHFEMDFVSARKEAILAEISKELADIRAYSPRPAYAYYPPKNDLCYRRMIYIPFKDLVVRYAFTIVLADLLDGDLSPHCFANRRARGEGAKFAFLENFAEVSWPSFCRWQRDCASEDEITTLIRTDISAFYDSISHDYLVDSISSSLEVEKSTDLMEFFHRILHLPVISYSH